MEKETWENISLPTPPQATDKLAVRETRHCCPKICSSWWNRRQRKGRGRMDRPQWHTRGEQTTARTGTSWSDGQFETRRGWCFWNKQAPKPSAGTYPNFSNSCRSSFNPCFVPRLCSSEGPLCYLNLMVSMAFAQCFLMVCAKSQVANKNKMSGAGFACE